MKKFLLIGTLFSLNVGAQTNVTEKEISFIPLAIGNYWIYSNTNHPRLNKIDTLRIIDKVFVAGDSAFKFSNGSLMFEKNDSVYDYQNQWAGDFFRCLEYFPSDKEVEFGITIGGDVGGWRRVTKLKRPYKVNGKLYSNCYMFYNPTNTVIICKGVGIIETQTEGNTATLVDYKLVE